MARRTKNVTIPGTRSDTLGERDNGKTFILREMDAYAGQDWALRACLALSRAGVQLSSAALAGGWATLAGYAFEGLLQARYEDVAPLLAELLSLVSYAAQPDNPKFPTVPIKPGPNCQVEEIGTFLTLYREQFELHTGFTLPAGDLTTEASPSSPPAPAG
jgi:hypothetical protein